MNESGTAGPVSNDLPRIYLARHGETAWTISGQHTGLTDLPLTERGEQNAVLLGKKLHTVTFSSVFTSPLQRARRTAELAGYAGVAQVDPDLVEWNYGDYEGLKGADIRMSRPDWDIFRDGPLNGETPDQISARADRVVNRVRKLSGNVLLFSSAHILRVLTPRWLGLSIDFGRYLILDPTSLSIVGFDRSPTKPAIRLWNDTDHVPR